MGMMMKSIERGCGYLQWFPRHIGSDRSEVESPSKPTRSQIA
jgi:hypothetical protein